MRKVPGSLPASEASASTAVTPTIGVAPAPIVPGEPTSFGSLAATNAPYCPTTLRFEIAALSSPAALSKVGRGEPLGDAAERDGGAQRAAVVEQVDRVPARGEPHAGARVAADLQAGGRRPAEPQVDEGLRLRRPAPMRCRSR